jgi:hypothetical protein
MILERPLLRSLEDARPSFTDMRFAERAPARRWMPRQARQAINQLAVSAKPYGRKLNPHAIRLSVKETQI